MTCYPRHMTGVYQWLRRRIFPPVPADIRDDIALLRAHRVETLTPALFLTLAATTPTAIYAVVDPEYEGFRDNLARLQDHGWLFELQVFAGQMKDAAALVRAFPGIRFVLLHAGMLEDLSPAGRAAWSEGMQRLADLPNMYVKLSGLGTFLHRVDEAHIADVALQTVAWFGSSRCAFGSNFPIEKLWSSYGELAAAYRRALSPLPADDQAAIFSGTARRLYRLD